MTKNITATQIPPVATSEARLRSFVTRIENVEAERAELGQDIKDLFTEVKSAGFDVKAVRALLRERKAIHKDGQEVYEESQLVLSTYRSALDRLAAMPVPE